MHQGSVLSPLIFAIVVDVVTEHAREGLLNEILYADDLVLMSESLDDLRERFQTWCNDLSKRQSQLPLETLDRHRTRE